MVFDKSLVISLMVMLGGAVPATVAAPISQTPAEPAIAPTGPALSTLSTTYGATLPAASSPGREVTLTLNPDGIAEMTTDYLNGDAPIVQSGIWRSSGGSVVRVTFDQQNGESLETTSDIIFRVVNGNLVAVVYDRSVYGTAGLVLEPR